MSRKPDGIYTEETVRQFTQAVSSAGQTIDLSPDANIFAWYRRALSGLPTECHFLDWGSGTGRFIPFYQG